MGYITGRKGRLHSKRLRVLRQATQLEVEASDSRLLGTPLRIVSSERLHAYRPVKDTVPISFLEEGHP